MKIRAVVAASLVALLAACGGDSETTSVTLLAYDSFTPSEGIFDSFTAETGIEVATPASWSPRRR
jgi:spermidine/putrescine-binding protein